MSTENPTDNSLDFDPNVSYAEAQAALTDSYGAGTQGETAAVDMDPTVTHESPQVEQGTEGDVVVDPETADAGEAVPVQSVDIELPIGEIEPAEIEILRSSGEVERNEEASGIEEFKTGVKQRFGGMLSRAGDLWSKVKGATANAAWMGAYGAYKAPSVIAEGVAAGFSAVADTSERAAEKIISGVEGVRDSGRAFVADAREAAGEVGGAIKEAAADMGRDAAFVGRKVVGGIETAALVGVGAGILASEMGGKAINASLELGKRGLDAGEQFIRSSIETAKQKKEQALQKMAAMKASSIAAATSVTHAAESKTVEAVNGGKEMIANAVTSVAEAATALKERAESRAKSAWETLKNKGNMIKRGLIMAKVGYHESQGKRISDKAGLAFAKANKARAGLAALATTPA